jgi:type IV secretory pathway VirB2 component (pilin)
MNLQTRFSVPAEIRTRILTLAAILLFGFAVPAFADGTNPWESAVNSLSSSFTGAIAKGLSLVAIVVGGLMFAFGEGGSKKMLSGIVFGLGMVLGAANFISWLFPGN